jgi:hypothetical protein
VLRALDPPKFCHTELVCRLMLPLMCAQLHVGTLVPLKSTCVPDRKAPKRVIIEKGSLNTPAVPVLVPARSTVMLTFDDVTSKFPFSDQTGCVLCCYLAGGLPVEVEGGRATSQCMLQHKSIQLMCLSCRTAASCTTVWMRWLLTTCDQPAAIVIVSTAV